MSNVYIQALFDSLNKKVDVLNQIREKNAEQAAILKKEPFSFEEFDNNTEEKGILIHRLNQLDEGFESLYEHVKDELDANRAAYASEIHSMQALITKITDLGTAIEAEEARNKASLESFFASERAKIKGVRSGMKAVQSYNQAMNYKN